MKYGKLIDNELVFSPKKVQTVIDEETYNVYNPTAELLVEQGWFPIITSEPGEPVEGYHYEAHYEEQGNQIVEVWELVSNEEMEIDDGEALAIILGEQ